MCSVRFSMPIQQTFPRTLQGLSAAVALGTAEPNRDVQQGPHWAHKLCVTQPLFQADSRSASQKPPPFTEQCVQQLPAPLPILNQMEQLHTLPPSMLILSSSSERSVPFGFYQSKFVPISHLLCACYMTIHLSLVVITLITSGEECEVLSCTLCRFVQPPVTSPLRHK
jgi:hypothetical protein